MSGRGPSGLHTNELPNSVVKTISFTHLYLSLISSQPTIITQDRLLHLNIGQLNIWKSMKTCFPYLNTSKLDEDSHQTNLRNPLTLHATKRWSGRKDTARCGKLVALSSPNFKVLYTIKGLWLYISFLETSQVSLTMHSL